MIAGKCRLFSIENHHVSPSPIEKVVVGEFWPDVLAYDEKKVRLVAVRAEHPRLHDLDKELLSVPLSNGGALVCEKGQKVLTLDRGYVIAAEVSKGDELVSSWAGHDPSKTHFMTQPRPGKLVVTDVPSDAGKDRTFALTTATGNVVCEGVVVATAEEL